MNFVTITLVGDGSSDACLIPVINWLISENFPEIPYRVEFARNLPPHRDGLAARITTAVRCYPCNVLVVHRDAERDPSEKRRIEIADAAAGVSVPVVPAVPVRMVESWLLLSEETIRIAADNPNGRVPLCLPPISRLESEVDPKETLFDALLKASELSGRRRNKFHVDSRSRVDRRFHTTAFATQFSAV